MFSRTMLQRFVLSLVFAAVLLVVLRAQAANYAPQSGAWQLFEANAGGDSISMVSEWDGWILSTGGSLYRWNGAAWSQAGVVTHSQDIIMTDIDVVTANDGWLALAGPLSGAEDATTSLYRWNGATWAYFTTLTAPNGVSIWGIDMLSATDGWAVGSTSFGSIFFHWNGTSWVRDLETFLPVIADRALEMVSAVDGWAAGSSGHFMRWDGNDWQVFSQPVTSDIFGLDMLSAGDGWAVGDAGVILRWNGATWSQVPSPTTVRLWAVSMGSTNDGWAVGEEGVIIHWDGSSWQPAASPTTQRIYDLKMLSADLGWATGSDVFRYVAYDPLASANYATGAPGSTFTIEGAQFPPDTDVEVWANWRSLGSVTTDSAGALTFLLTTDDADEGAYFIRVGDDPGTGLWLTLDADEPVRPQDGEGPLLDVPEGIAFNHFLYLPVSPR